MWIFMVILMYLNGDCFSFFFLSKIALRIQNNAHSRCVCYTEPLKMS